MAENAGVATVERIYVEVVKPLPSSERLKLAMLILNGIPEESLVDYSTEWSEEDVRDFTEDSMRTIEQLLEQPEIPTSRQAPLTR